mmetsp:Transcript_11371/g.36263  ORF Transcript_11371/g.36263 Transcript_11371/m.36263 type:complete len:246 (-) Transcript_11371:106-843(-)
MGTDQCLRPVPGPRGPRRQPGQPRGSVSGTCLEATTRPWSTRQWARRVRPIRPCARHFPAAHRPLWRATRRSQWRAGVGRGAWPLRARGAHAQGGARRPHAEAQLADRHQLCFGIGTGQWCWRSSSQSSATALRPTCRRRLWTLRGAPRGRRTEEASRGAHPRPPSRPLQSPSRPSRPRLRGSRSRSRRCPRGCRPRRRRCRVLLARRRPWPPRRRPPGSPCAGLGCSLPTMSPRWRRRPCGGWT